MYIVLSQLLLAARKSKILLLKAIKILRRMTLVENSLLSLSSIKTTMCWSRREYLFKPTTSQIYFYSFESPQVSAALGNLQKFR